MKHVVSALVGAVIALAFITVKFSYRIYNLERQMIRIEQEYQKVIKLKPWEFLTPYYMRLRDGRVFYSGMPFYNSVIERFERDGTVFLADGFCFPVSWLEFE